MKKISTIEFTTSLDVLRSAAATGRIAPELLDPLQSLVTPLMEQITRRPTAVYLLSSDDTKELRDLLGCCLAIALLPHVKTALLVDSDFLNVGMGGIVPQKDSLGFLDLLLYGSSMKAIIQRTEAGFFVIGAGSFQVTKKLPFSMESFQSAVRYLLNQAKCVIFSGPAEDDSGTVQPMAETTDTIIYVRQVARPGAMPFDQFETKLTPLDETNLYAVSVVLEAGRPGDTRPEPKPVAVDETPPERSEAAMETPPQAPAESTAPVSSKQDTGEAADEPEKIEDRDRPSGETEAGVEPAAGSPGRKGAFYTWDTVEEPHSRSVKNSLGAKIAMGVIPVMLVALIFWWLFYTKSYREEDTQPPDRETPAVAVMTDSTNTVTQPLSADTGLTVAEEPAAQQVAEQDTQPVEAAETPRPREQIAETTPEPAAGEPAVYESLEVLAGTYLIHISSFRKLENAEDDAHYLLGKGFKTCIVHIDLGSKGIWYRVYCGPYDTRDDARGNKLELESLDRVKFARIAKVPG